jgi:hypothetical protein
MNRVCERSEPVGLFLTRIIHDGSSRNRAVAKRDRRAEPGGGVTPRLGVPKGVCPLRGDSTRGLAPL